MNRVRIHCFSVSLDGFGTGEGQSLDAPFGHAGHSLVGWALDSEANAKNHPGHSPRYGVVNDMIDRSFRDIGATVMGRNMFGVPGVWDDDSWIGWWGDNPVYQHPVFVMTHKKREPLELKGGTTFHFVQGAPEEVLAHAKAAAGEHDVCVRGGVSTARVFLQKGLVDEAHIVIAPIVLGRGERLWDGLDNLIDLYDVVEAIGIDRHTHVRLVRKN